MVQIEYFASVLVTQFSFARNAAVWKGKKKTKIEQLGFLGSGILKKVVNFKFVEENYELFN
jgi:hypothetical protein